MKKLTKLLSIIGISTMIGIGAGAAIALSFDDGSEGMIKAVKGEEIKAGVDSDKHIVDVMHKMTHQKVISKEKQGFIKMTTENIEKVRNVVNGSTPLSLKHEGKYREILYRWANKDCSQVVEDHNYMLEQIDDSNDGKAERIATPEEEQSFLIEQAKKERENEGDN
ncbi:hypothetical protein SAMN04488168_109156 [Bacillus sp. 491mf]|uniref:DUF6241 domain-containing protein n=1 Tax=Bacillus sp. 491mf TaxID=1761755 RepID=UPI0008DEC79E|nr:DUF6241 domain-containing protein [Bacillus sp. 491mf]SFC78903.1 hypothetical protein SAMN04488168_109156 [Bacillus sp. 491mf]